ncbi:MAG: hypothetical protein KatS3mg131_2080 [Candidatus Tectimicrobiota bacterium]|nr:MAG: hypothetical protein KatS3mg131_2080 [Candidatus Tectomicrobia bacterium]
MSVIPITDVRWTKQSSSFTYGRIGVEPSLRTLAPKFTLLFTTLWQKIPEQSLSSSIEVEKLLESLQEHHVHLKNTNKIQEYLLQFPDLIDVVPHVVDAAARHFPDAQLVMDMYQDPEIEDRYLVVYVRLKRYDDSIVEKLERAEAEFLDELAYKEGWIQLTTDFQEPGEEDAL